LQRIKSLFASLSNLSAPTNLAKSTGNAGGFAQVSVGNNIGTSGAQIAKVGKAPFQTGASLE